MTKATARAPDVALLVLAIFLAATAAARWRSAVPARADAPPSVGAAPSIASRPDADALRDEANAVVERDPFRIGRTPSTVPYVPAARRNAEIVNAPPPTPKPQLVLKGIFGGPPWMALMDGIPGEQPGALVREGTVYDKLTIRTITRDSVVVQFPDTTWTLTLAAPGGRR